MVDETEYLRMQLAVIQADALHTRQAAENERLRAELDGAARGAKDLLEACGAAADVEEGRDPIEAARAVRTELVETHDRANEAESRLATATALLERWVNAPEITQHVYLSGEADMDLGRDTKAFLAGQPAAPTHPRVTDDMAYMAREHESDCMHGLAPPSRFERRVAETAELPVTVMASSAMPEREPTFWCDNCEESMEREGDNPAGVCDVCWNSHQADKAVLDTMARIEEKALRHMATGAWCGHGQAPAIAELARRGLK